jgi:hypothetical protein
MIGERSIEATRVAAAFFLSGFAAAVYQVAWQRLLFVIVGVDIESITIIVSTLMLGLGVGALSRHRLGHVRFLLESSSGCRNFY